MADEKSYEETWENEEFAYLSELQRLKESRKRTKNWKRWGPYLSERQWGTVSAEASSRDDETNMCIIARESRGKDRQKKSMTRETERQIEEKEILKFRE